MSGIQSKLTRQAEKQENGTDYSIIDKDIKRIIIMEFCMFRNLEERLNTLNRSIEKFKGYRSNSTF